jgi:hypothetical protein
MKPGLFVAIAATLGAVQPMPPADAQALQPADRSAMRLTFSDTFNGPLSWCSELCQGQKWRTKYFHSGDTPLSRGLGLNGSESEIFIDPAYLGLGINPFRNRNGELSLLVEPASNRVRRAVMAAWPASYTGVKVAPQFTAGMLTTEKSFRQLYGYFEARIKVPHVAGAWPAFWLLGDPGTFDEIDVMEILAGRPTRHNLGHQWKGADGKKHSERMSLDTTDLSTGFHTYGVLWTADAIVYYRDNVEVGRFANPGLHRPMYLIVSMGMDGDWNKQEGFVAAPDAHARMDIQSVRAYALGR